LEARSVTVATDPPYDVRVGAGLLEVVEAITPRYSRVVVVSDENVSPLYLERLGDSLGQSVIVLPAGEATKSFSTLEHLLVELTEYALDRDAALVALGGGVIGDLVGLAAALYMRGIRVVQCPTTLLSQVDASVGGKTAVNLPTGKNLAGVFHQPDAVFADVSTLPSLSESEFTSGLGEVLKTAILDGEEALQQLELNASRLLDRDFSALADTVERCVNFKAKIVTADPKESGPRKCLNLGHTYAHAIEHIAGFGTVPHGIAVAAGIGMAFDQAGSCGILEDMGLAARVRKLAGTLGLPDSLEALESSTGLLFPEQALLSSMTTDKKNSGGKISLVLPVRAGQVRVGVTLDQDS
jgi:3-dehydroquinate synthase